MSGIRLKIRVNAILPGTFPTDITARINDAGHQELLPAVKKVVMRTPLGRAGTKEEILGPVLMLSSQAGRYMTNAVISVDGGRSMVSAVFPVVSSLQTLP
jgi:NAD(P)-dependent dehydrogenase (short-subunit alcohol dehydrogenase family)